MEYCAEHQKQFERFVEEVRRERGPSSHSAPDSANVWGKKGHETHEGAEEQLSNLAETSLEEGEIRD